MSAIICHFCLAVQKRSPVIHSGRQMLLVVSIVRFMCAVKIESVIGIYSNGI